MQSIRRCSYCVKSVVLNFCAKFDYGLFATKITSVFINFLKTK